MQDGCSGLKLYCNTVYCIAGEGWVGWQILQYSLGQPVSQDGRLCRDTAQVGAGLGVAADVRWADWAQGAGLGVLCAQAGSRQQAGRTGGQALGRAGRHGADSRARARARARRAGGRQQARAARSAPACGRWARGAGRGRAQQARGLARTVHSVHST